MKGGGDRPLPQTGAKKIHSATSKYTHLQTPFCMPECAKTHLQQSRISKFSGGGPPDPPLQGEGREREVRGGEGREREGGRGRIGKGGEGREGTVEGGRRRMGGGGEERGGRGARHGLRLPPRDKLWIRPCKIMRFARQLPLRNVKLRTTTNEQHPYKQNPR